MNNLTATNTITPKNEDPSLVTSNFGSKRKRQDVEVYEQIKNLYKYGNRSAKSLSEEFGVGYQNVKTLLRKAGTYNPETEQNYIDQENSTNKNSVINGVELRSQVENFLVQFENNKMQAIRELDALVDRFHKQGIIVTYTVEKDLSPFDRIFDK